MSNHCPECGSPSGHTDHVERAFDKLRTTDAMMAEGLAFWQRCGRGKDLDENFIDRHTDEMVRDGFHPTEAMRSEFACRWCHWAYPLLLIQSHSYAAALALTDVTEVVMPWPAFVVVVPPDLLVQERDGLESLSMTTICLWRVGDNVACLAHASHPPRDGSRSGVGSVLPVEVAYRALRGDLEPLSEPFAEGVEVAGELDVRIGRTALRIALNAATALLAKGDAGTFGTGSGPGVVHGVHPTARRFVVGQPVKTNFRQVVRDYVTGARRELRKIHWTVCGHWRDQPFGPGRAETRKKWIEPHFAKRAGTPDDAPILLREHVLEKP